MRKRLLFILIPLFIHILILSCINNKKETSMEFDDLKKIDSTIDNKTVIYFCEIAKWQGDYMGNMRILVDAEFNLYYAKNNPATVSASEFFNEDFRLISQLTASDLSVIYNWLKDKNFNSLPDVVMTPSNILVNGGSDRYLYIHYKDIHKSIKFEPETAFIQEFINLLNALIS